MTDDKRDERDTERSADSSTDTDTPAATDTDTDTDTTLRTRTRKRATSSSRGSATASGDDAGDPEDAEAGDRDDASDTAGDDRSSGRRRRGRRGGRGRGGRGRGGSGRSARDRDAGADRDDRADRAARDDASDRVEDDDTTTDEDAATDDTDERRDEDVSSSGEEETEDAIARGGTRMAAKRARTAGGRSAGGRNGRGRGNGRSAGVSDEVRRAILDGPPRTMLVTSQADRTQIAVLEDRTVVEHYVTRKEDVTYVGNIYMARVQNVLPGMEAAFLDIGKGRNGVLYAGEVLYDELDVEEGIDNPRIQDVLKQGQTVLVQVTKDPMGTKGPRLTMHLSLAGRYMVLAPNSDLFGISRKLTDKERDRLRRIVKKVKPDRHGVIVRTAAENATEEQLTADLERLLRKWEKVEERAADAKALTAVYEEPPLVVKVIRDNFGPEFERCIVDSEELYAQVRDYLEEVAPELMDKVELYGASSSEPAAGDGTDAPEADADDGGTTAKKGRGKAKPKAKASTDETEERPALFDAYDVTEQLRKAMGRKVWLPSGGYLIIESTEAMKVIDVNTGKFTGDAKSNLEEVVLKTNLEAADEIVRQLRLRDLGGIIIIDFIDMLLKANQDQVVRRLKRELLRDRTKTRVSEVSRLGLVQMTRKNVSQGLVEVFSHRCPECEGRGYISEMDE